MKRTYQQLCPLAGALDLIGDRWTLLIVRELLLGRRRFGELAEALPGIGSNLLAERLRRLEDDGLLTRGEGAYELTERGAQLKPVLLALARWGIPTLADPDADARSFRPSWLLLTLQGLFRPDLAAGMAETWEYRVDGDTFWLRVEDGEIDGGGGPAERPDLVVSTDAETFRAIGARRIRAAEALRSGRIAVTGDPERFLRSLDVIPLAG